ncbi:MAG: lipocalin-like domain-containing protein [Gammaproteobacteria bacterium]|nr:lipocalin-like domain-containing protein [Gammaproteobacteria bacterium]
MASRLTALLGGMALAVLTGCGDDAPRPADDAPVTLTERMGAPPDPGFARADAPRAFTFPQDHGAHPEFATEWWYFTGNLDASDGRRFGYQLTLFRVGLKPGAPADDSAWRTHQLYMGHLALSDVAARRHHSAERFSRAAAGLAGAQASPLRVWLGPWSISGAGDTTFPLTLRADTADIGLALTLARGAKPRVLQGEQGLSRKSAAPGNASYYYSHTRLPTHGRLRIGDTTHAVDGTSWFDREWSTSALADDQAGWDWFALQFDDRSELMLYQMRGVDGRAQRFSKGVLVAPDGRIQHLAHSDFALRPTRHWISDEGARYPVAWRIEVPRFGLALAVEATFDEQEMRHTVRYWEGAVDVTGTHSGRGYLELSGYAPAAESSASQ